MFSVIGLAKLEAFSPDFSNPDSQSEADYSHFRGFRSHRKSGKSAMPELAFYNHYFDVVIRKSLCFFPPKCCLICKFVPKTKSYPY